MDASLNRSRKFRASSFKGNCVLYWMVRDKRVNDNWALLKAQNIALKHGVPLLVCFHYYGLYKDANIRQYQFLLDGLRETQERLNQLQIQFYLISGRCHIELPKFIELNKVGHLVTDFSPLKVYKRRLKKVTNRISIPITQVDTHNIIPVWETSDKKEFAAYTIRPKIKKQLPEYLIEFPKIDKHPIVQKTKKHDIKWNNITDSLKLNLKIKPLDWIEPGEKKAMELLERLKTSLDGYHSDRNDPTINKLSNLSPYFHHGHISPQRVALEISKSDLQSEDKKAFLEEMIVRRELADNFCHYEKDYDFFGGFHVWAQKTLNEHRNDEREYIYPCEQFEAGETHDPLWNAAQNEMKIRGKMHGFMRMYWAKKILEWSPNPEIAQQTAINLNDKYQIDGRDPNGYTGIAWSIGGIHDRAWFERPIYGKIRYMNYNGCKRKFNVYDYINKYI